MIKKDNLFTKCFFIVGILLFFFLHLYKISAIPSGINADEMGMGYDAWSLANYGMDRYMNTYPVYLTNYGDGQSVMYAYLCSILLKFMDLSVITLRLPGVIMCFISFIYGYRFYMLFDENASDKAFWYIFLFNIFPVYIMPYRYGLDCNLLLPFAWIFVFYLCRAVMKGKILDYVLAGISGGLVLYTYAIAHVIMPLFIMIVGIYLLVMKKLDIKKILCFCVPLGILATPLILMQLINMMDLPELHIGKVTITKLYSYRIGDFGLSNLSIESIADCLRCIFFDDNDASHIIPAFGTIYKVSIPFFAIGFVNALINIMKSVKKKELNIMMLPFLWFMVVFFVGCCTSHLAVYHVNAIFISVLIFTIEGIVLFIEFINRVTGNIKNFKIGKYFKYITGIVIVGIYFAVFLKFAVYYYGEQYTSDFSTLSLFEHELDEPLSYLLDNEETQNVKDLTTYISGVFKGYIYFLETVKISPQEYNANNPMPGNDDASKVEWERKYNNYIFDMPENIVYNANYIVSCHEKELCQELEDKGFKKKEFDYYNVYVYDMANCSQVTGCADIVWNTGVEDGNRLIVENATQVLDAGESIVLVGYAYDKENMSCYDSIYLTAEKNNYYAEQTERPDVVEQTNEESLNMCGFLFIIPKSDISGRESMTLTLFNNDAHTYEKIEIEVVN